MPRFAIAKHRVHAGATSSGRTGSAVALRARAGRKNPCAVGQSAGRGFPGTCRVAFAQHHREVRGAMQTRCTRECGRRALAAARFLQKAGDLSRRAEGLPRTPLDRRRRSLNGGTLFSNSAATRHPGRRPLSRADGKAASRVSRSSAAASATVTPLAPQDRRLSRQKEASSRAVQRFPNFRRRWRWP